MKKKPGKKLNNQGFTLVELLVGIALAAFVSFMVGSLLSTVNQNYKHNQLEVELQYEGQTVVNQLKDLMIDTTKGITVSKDDGTGDIRILVFNDDSYFIIYWDKDLHSLFLDLIDDKNTDEGTGYSSDAVLISDYIYDFQIDSSQGEKRRIISYYLSLANEDGATLRYETSNLVNLRNGILIGKTRKQIYHL